MSNTLSRKKKKMQPLGYSKRELIGMQDYARRANNTDKLIKESFENLRLVTYQILHDKFGFGQKRIIRVENRIDEYLQSAESGELSTDSLQHFLKEKCGIAVKDEANRVPFRERLALTNYVINSASMKYAGMHLLASIYNYFALLGVCLKTQFKFSTRQIKEVYQWIRYYINSLALWNESGGKRGECIKGIAGVLMDECKYCDGRFERVKNMQIEPEQTGQLRFA